jgi:hypothetical protein
LTGFASLTIIGDVVGRSIALIAMLAALGCTEERGGLIVNLDSSLEIPNETDALLVRVVVNGDTIGTESYDLGPYPRNAWPQSLPVVSTGGATRRVTIAAELRKASAGQPPILVGYGAIDATLPTSGTASIALEIARLCDSSDGFGTGPGCKGPPQMMPVTDAGTPPDAMTTMPPPDAGTTPPACVPVEGPCTQGQVCYQNHCRATCDNMTPCQDPSMAYCLPQGVCDCTLGCTQMARGCYPFTCEANGCCKL